MALKVTTLKIVIYDAGIVEVYGIDVLFTVTFVGGPDTSIPSISKVPIFKVASFPVSFQFCWTRTAVTSFREYSVAFSERKLYGQ